ncbi:FAD-binding oxidoreductase [soil metagenome]
MNEFLENCRKTIGNLHVLTDDVDMKPFVTDWRQRAEGKALAVLQPGSNTEVAALVKLCSYYSVCIVPQGGNTGLVLGSTPDKSGKAVVISLKRLNNILNIDIENNTMVVEAGCLLSEVQEAALQSGRLYPLSLASEGSCTIGGNLSTNAGGTAVLRYGNARELCLGLEVVTATGEIWSGLRALRKDNTGYDLRDLFIGAEGTLGIITAAVLKLYPQPKAKITAFAAIKHVDAAINLLALAQENFSSTLTGFELMSNFCMQLVLKHFPLSAKIFPQAYPQYVLFELSSNMSDQQTQLHVEEFLDSALKQGLIVDAVIATSIAQSQELWKLRELISSAQAAEGKNIKHDVSLPASRIAEFIEQTDCLLQQSFPECRMVTFGHLGDGNLHYNVSPPENVEDADFMHQQPKINRIVHDSVHRFNGSISAEHGLGALKKDEILLYKSLLEMQLMRSIKTALDPHGLMNPGKLI